MNLTEYWDRWDVSDWFKEDNQCETEELFLQTEPHLFLFAFNHRLRAEVHKQAAAFSL